MLVGSTLQSMLHLGTFSCCWGYCVNNRSSTTRPSQTSASSALPIGSLAFQPGSVDGQDSVGSPVLGPKSEMVIQAAQCSSREVHQGSDSPVGSVQRYLHKRLNGPLWQSVDNRSVASYQDYPTHKEVGVTGIQKAVHRFLPLIRAKAVMFHSDNSSAVVYLSNQGGTHLLPMFLLTWDILL